MEILLLIQTRTGWCFKCNIENSLMIDLLSYLLYFGRCYREILIFFLKHILYKLKELIPTFFRQSCLRGSQFQMEIFHLLLLKNLYQLSLLLNNCFEVLKMIKNYLFIHFLNIISLFSMSVTEGLYLLNSLFYLYNIFINS